MSKLTLTYRSDEESFAEFLKRVRLGFGIELDAFAAFLGVKQEVLDRWMTGDTRYIHATRLSKWQTMGIVVRDTEVQPDRSAFEELKDEVESLVDDDGNVLYDEQDIRDTTEWIRLFKASKESKSVSDAEIRKWARAQGMKVPVRGRLAARLRVAHQLANN